MKIGYLVIILLTIACTSCFSSNGGKRVAVLGGEEIVGVEMRNGEISEPSYERKESVGDYLVFRSERGVERVVLVKESNVKEVVPFGLWVNVEKIGDSDLGELVQILERFVRREVPIEIQKAKTEANHRQDVLAVDVPKSRRRMFNARAAAEKCIARLEAGWLPRRVLKEDTAYVFDCVLPGMTDSGYLISIRRYPNGFRVTKAEFYQYDRIPKRPHQQHPPRGVDL